MQITLALASLLLAVTHFVTAIPIIDTTTAEEPTGTAAVVVHEASPPSYIDAVAASPQNLSVTDSRPPSYLFATMRNAEVYFPAAAMVTLLRYLESRTVREEDFELPLYGITALVPLPPHQLPQSLREGVNPENELDRSIRFFNTESGNNETEINYPKPKAELSELLHKTFLEVYPLLPKDVTAQSIAQFISVNLIVGVIPCLGAVSTIVASSGNANFAVMGIVTSIFDFSFQMIVSMLFSFLLAIGHVGDDVEFLKGVVRGAYAATLAAPVASTPIIAFMCGANPEDLDRCALAGVSIGVCQIACKAIHSSITNRMPKLELENYVFGKLISIICSSMMAGVFAALIFNVPLLTGLLMGLVSAPSPSIVGLIPVIMSNAK